MPRPPMRPRANGRGSVEPARLISTSTRRLRSRISSTSSWIGSGRESARRTRLEVEEFREFEAPEMWERVAAYSRATRAAVADAVRARRLPTDFPADEVSLRLGYTGGASLRTMLQSYRIAQAVSAEVWTEAVVTISREGSKAKIARELAVFLFAYEDRLVDWIHSRWEEYSRSDDSSPTLLPSVRRVLEGDVAAAEELDYSLAADHIAVIAWGPDALKELTRDRRLPSGTVVGSACDRRSLLGLVLPARVGE